MKRTTLLVGLLWLCVAASRGDIVLQSVDFADPDAGRWSMIFIDGSHVTIERPEIVPDRTSGAVLPTPPDFGADVWSHLIDKQEGVFSWMTPPVRQEAVEDCICDLFPGLYAGRECPKCGRHCPPFPGP